jgi:hypothetical protein
VPAAEVEYLQLGADELSAYTGEYRAILTRVAIELKDGELYLQATPQGGFPKPDSPATPTPPAVRLAFISPDEAMMLDFPFKGGIIAFIRNEAGALEWVRFGGRIHKKQ